MVHFILVSSKYKAWIWAHSVNFLVDKILKWRGKKRRQRGSWRKAGKHKHWLLFLIPPLRLDFDGLLVQSASIFTPNGTTTTTTTMTTACGKQVGGLAILDGERYREKKWPLRTANKVVFDVSLVVASTRHLLVSSDCMMVAVGLAVLVKMLLSIFVCQRRHFCPRGRCRPTHKQNKRKEKEKRAVANSGKGSQPHTHAHAHAQHHWHYAPLRRRRRRRRRETRRKAKRRASSQGCANIFMPPTGSIFMMNGNWYKEQQFSPIYWPKCLLRWGDCVCTWK